MTGWEHGGLELGGCDMSNEIEIRETHGAVSQDSKRADKSGAAILFEMGNTFKLKEKEYGDSIKRAGAAMNALFPNGLRTEGSVAWMRLDIVSIIVSKLARYAVSMEQGKVHADSIHDVGVYAAILEGEDIKP